MTAGIPYDSTDYIRSAIDEVLTTLSHTLLIVIAVIFLFLGSLRSVIIPVVAIPISLIGAVFIMMAGGFTINLLTLLAIVLSVGLVVDDAIVMVENVERHIHLGKSAFEAALHAARELVGPIIAMTITLAAVYTPLALQGGLTGSLFREFAFTLAGAVIVSGVVALTLSPMMSSKLLRAGDTERGFAGVVNRRFEALRARYSRILSGTLNYRPVVFTLWVLVVLLIFPFYLFSQRELAPAEDQGVVFGIIQGSANATIDQTRLFANQMVDVFEKVPETHATFQLTFPTFGFGGMVAKPWDERDKTSAQLQMEASQELSKIPGVRIIPITPAPLPGGGDFPVDLVIASTAEPRELYEFANQLVGKAFQSGLFMFADADLKFDQPQAEVVFDRDKVRSLGVDLSQAGRDLSTLLGGNYVNRFSIQGRSYKVIPQIKRSERLTPDQLKDIYVTGGDGGLVSLATFATVETSTEPRELKRFQQLNAVRIQGVIPPGVALDQALGAPRGGSGQAPAAGLHPRLRRRVAAAAHRGQEVPRHVPALGDPHLPGARGAVRELPRSVHRPRGFGAAGARRCAALLVPGFHQPQHLQPGRTHHPGRPGGEERHPDRRVRQPPAGAGSRQVASGDRGLEHPAAADPDDHRRHRRRALSAGLRHRPGRRSPQLDRHHAGLGHDHRLGVHAVRGAVDLRPGGADPQGARSVGKPGRHLGSLARRGRNTARICPDQDVTAG